MSTFGVQSFSNGPGGETYKSFFVIYRCDICGQLFDNDFAKAHAGVHELRNALSETENESNGIVTVLEADYDVLKTGLEETKEEFSTQQDEGEDG